MFRVESTDRYSYMEMKLIEIEKRLPSLCVSLEIFNHGFSARLLSVWIDWENIMGFISNSKEIAYKNTFDYSLESMSPGEMNIRIQKVSSEVCSLNYSLNKRTSEQEQLHIRGAFSIGVEKLEDLRTAFLEVGDYNGY